MSDKEALGKIVRDVWIRRARRLPNPKPSHLIAWDELDEWNKETDRQIGAAVAAAVTEEYARQLNLPTRLSRVIVAFYDGHWWTVYIYNAKQGCYVSTGKTVGGWEALQPEDRQHVIDSVLG